METLEKILEPASKAVEFIQLGYRESYATCLYTRQKQGHAVDEIVDIAVNRGFKWNKDDLFHLEKGLRVGARYYVHNFVGSITDNHYAMGCGANRGLENRSFCIAYENYHGFKPFILKDETKSGRRLYVGCEVMIEGLSWKVSSFGPKYEYLNLIRYKNEWDNKKWSQPRSAGDWIHDYENGKSVRRQIANVTQEPLTWVFGAISHESRESPVVANRIRWKREDILAFNAAMWPKKVEVPTDA